MNSKNEGRFKELQHKVRVLEASQLNRRANAIRNIDKCGEKYLASAVTLAIRNINRDNTVIIEEVCIDDGLSADTIAALKRDLIRSYDAHLAHPVNRVADSVRNA